MYEILNNFIRFTLAVNSTNAKVCTAGSFTIVYSCLYAVTISLIPLTWLSLLLGESLASCLKTAISVVVIKNIHPQKNKKLARVTIPVSSGTDRRYLLQK